MRPGYIEGLLAERGEVACQKRVRTGQHEQPRPQSAKIMIERGGGFAGTLAHGVRHDVLLVSGGAEHQVGAEHQ